MPSRPIEDTLRAEARWLHAALLGTPCPAEVEAAYLAAHDHYCQGDQDSPLLAAIVERRLDAEAVELALRHRNPVLSRKCRILVYLLEARPDSYPRLVNPAPRRLEAWWALGWAGARTVWKRLKGEWLVRRHGLA